MITTGWNYKPTAPTWQLMQVGNAIAPRMEQVCTLEASLVEATSKVHAGADIDHFRGKRAPLRSIKVNVSGVYECCPAECCDAVQEWEGVRWAYGREAPFLFSREPTPNEPAEELWDGVELPPCTTYAWAFGKITKAPTNFTPDNWDRSGHNEVTFDAMLYQPLREITWDRWRYGPQLENFSPILSPSLSMDLESAQVEDKRLWYKPCELPPICDYDRFWFRNILTSTPTTVCAPQDWPNLHGLSNRGEGFKAMEVWVRGNWSPRVRVFMTPNTQVFVSNVMGSKTYVYNQSLQTGNVMIHTDSETGVVAGYTGNNVYRVARGAGVGPIELEPGENKISILRGDLQISIEPRWVG